MQIKFILAPALAALLAAGAAQAQTPAPPSSATARNPVMGDPGNKPAPRRPNARALARADKQPSGTENGNQPDRASAGGGSR